MISVSSIWTRFRNGLKCVLSHIRWWIKHATQMGSTESLEFTLEQEVGLEAEVSSEPELTSESERHLEPKVTAKPFEANTDNDQITMLGTQFYTFCIWRRIVTWLPNEYMLPNPDSIRILLPMTADSYRNLFCVPYRNPLILVDEQVWNRIKAALPKDYQLPKAIV
jgi:hypothetical protein